MLNNPHTARLCVPHRICGAATLLHFVLLGFANGTLAAVDSNGLWVSLQRIDTATSAPIAADGTVLLQGHDHFAQDSAHSVHGVHGLQLTNGDAIRQIVADTSEGMAIASGWECLSDLSPQCVTSTCERMATASLRLN